jgi:peptidyl-prolyl cis-trans isomerase C
MTPKLNTRHYTALALSLFLLAGNSLAAERAIATVNNVKIQAGMLEFMVANNVAQGLKDTPELRAALRTELIAREVLSQEARKQNLDKDAQYKTQLLMQQNTLLVERLIAKQAAKKTITDVELGAEYQRQLDMLADAEQYQVSHIVMASEADAKAVIKAAKDGAAFDKLAREKSASATAPNGGILGWLLPSQINPALANVMVNLNVGSVSALPIATSEGWQIIRLDGKRKFKVPSFEESKQQLVNAVYASERAAFVQKLVKGAKVE